MACMVLSQLARLRCGVYKRGLVMLCHLTDLPIDPLNNQVNISQFADDLGM